MTSKERVRASINHKQPDIVPADFACVWSVMEKLMKHYGLTDSDQVYRKFGSDIRYEIRYISVLNLKATMRMAILCPPRISGLRANGPGMGKITTLLPVITR